MAPTMVYRVRFLRPHQDSLALRRKHKYVGDVDNNDLDNANVHHHLRPLLHLETFRGEGGRVLNLSPPILDRILPHP